MHTFHFSVNKCSEKLHKYFISEEKGKEGKKSTTHQIWLFSFLFSLSAAFEFIQKRILNNTSGLLCGKFLWHSLYSFMWGVSESYTPCTLFTQKFIWLSLFCFTWGVSLTCPMLFYVESFSYTPHAFLCGEFLSHAPCYFMLGVSITRPMLFHVGSFSNNNTPHAVFYGEFVLNAPSCFM